MQHLAVTVWVCPDCQSYYASSNVPDLSKTPQPGLHGKTTGKFRAICPSPPCFTKGTVRVAHIVTVLLKDGEE